MSGEFGYTEVNYGAGTASFREADSGETALLPVGGSPIAGLLTPKIALDAQQTRFRRSTETFRKWMVATWKLLLARDGSRKPHLITWPATQSLDFGLPRC
jgi:hypothetical protein